MKIFIFSILLLLISNSIMAKQVRDFSSEPQCVPYYENEIDYIDAKKERIILNSYSAVGTIGAVIAAVAVVPGVIVLGGGALAAVIVHSSSNWAERALDLLDQDSKRFKKLLKRAQKIDHNVTSESLQNHVILGMNGPFCENYSPFDVKPKLKRPFEIRDSILKALESNK